MGCGEFERDWLVGSVVLVCAEIGRGGGGGGQRVVGSILESERVNNGSIAVGKRGGGICYRVMEKVGECAG